MTAYTDEYLGLIRKIFDILGVKVAHQDQKPPRISDKKLHIWLHIMNDAKSRQCPLDQNLTISQDKDEIYLPLASHPRKNLEYIHARKP